MTTDNLTRARAVLAGLRAHDKAVTPAPWVADEGMEWGAIRGPAGETVLYCERLTDADMVAMVAYRNAVPALLRLAEAVGRLASESGGGRTWWEKVGLHGTPRWCMICNGSATPPLADSSVVHRPGCPAIEIDAALAELAAPDGGDHA